MLKADAYTVAESLIVYNFINEIKIKLSTAVQ